MWPPTCIDLRQLAWTYVDFASEKFPDIVEKRPETTALYYNNSAVTPLFKPPDPKSRKLRRKTACAGLERLRRGRNAAVEGFIVKVWPLIWLLGHILRIVLPKKNARGCMGIFLGFYAFLKTTKSWMKPRNFIHHIEQSWAGIMILRPQALYCSIGKFTGNPICFLTIRPDGITNAHEVK